MRSMYLRFCLIGILFCTFLSITAQTSEWINLHKGNVAFKSGDMATAEKAYRQALKESAQCPGGIQPWRRLSVQQRRAKCVEILFERRKTRKE